MKCVKNNFVQFDDKDTRFYTLMQGLFYNYEKSFQILNINYAPFPISLE